MNVTFKAWKKKDSYMIVEMPQDKLSCLGKAFKPASVICLFQQWFIYRDVFKKIGSPEREKRHINQAFSAPVGGYKGSIVKIQEKTENTSLLVRNCSYYLTWCFM